MIDFEAYRRVLETPHEAQCENWHSAHHRAIVFWREECLQWLCWEHLRGPCQGCAIHDFTNCAITD